MPEHTASAADAGRETLSDTIRHQKFSVFRPAIAALGKPDLLLAEWVAMGGAGVMLVRRPVADMAVHDDQGGPVLVPLGRRDGFGEALAIVCVGCAKDIPAIALESRRDILAESKLGAALDRDVIIVEEIGRESCRERGCQYV